MQLLVNGTSAGPPLPETGPPVRTWRVPASAWRPGYNTLSLVTPEVVVPATRGGGNDTRTLGLSVRAVTLELSTATSPVAATR